MYAELNHHHLIVNIMITLGFCIEFKFEFEFELKRRLLKAPSTSVSIYTLSLTLSFTFVKSLSIFQLIVFLPSKGLFINSK